MLRETPVQIRVFPCKCIRPGTERRKPPKGYPDEPYMREQYEQRKALGLPVLTDGEKAGFHERWE